MSIDSAIQSVIVSAIRSALRPDLLAQTTPATFGTVALWLDRGASGTLFQDGAATVPASGTDPVGAWADAATPSVKAVQVDNSKRMALSGNYVVGNGSSEWLAATLGSPVGGASFAGAVVLNRTNAGIKGLVGNGDAAGQWRFYQWSSGELDFTIPGVSDYTSSGANVASGAAYVVGFRVSGGNVKLYRGSTLVLTAALGATPTAANPLAVGAADSSGSFTLDGGLAEVAIFSADLSDANWTALIAWLGAKHGISV